MSKVAIHLRYYMSPKEIDEIDLWLRSNVNYEDRRRDLMTDNLFRSHIVHILDREEDAVAFTLKFGPYINNSVDASPSLW